jgi:radical SAM-linked protein
VRDQPEQQAPPVQRLRVRYAKRGRLRFTSHRDFSRAFERAVVRARVPMAYSSGFSPHPRISYAGASPTGAASEAEYLEIGLSRTTAPAEVLAALDEALPPGLDVLEVVESPGGSLTDLLEASVWRCRVPGLSPDEARRAVTSFLAADEVPVERMTKKGLRAFDCRAAVVRLAASSAQDGEAECAILDLVLRHGTPTVRPDDVLAGLRSTSGLEAAAAPFHERLAQGPLDTETGTVGDPLAPNRDTA